MDSQRDKQWQDLDPEKDIDRINRMAGEIRYEAKVTDKQIKRAYQWLVKIFKRKEKKHGMD